MAEPGSRVALGPGRAEIWELAVPGRGEWGRPLPRDDAERDDALWTRSEPVP